MIVLSVVAALGLAVAIILYLAGVPIASLAGRVALFVVVAVMTMSLIVQLSHLRRGGHGAMARRVLPDPTKPVLSADGHLAFAPGRGRTTHGQG